VPKYIVPNAMFTPVISVLPSGGRRPHAVTCGALRYARVVTGPP